MVHSTETNPGVPGGFEAPVSAPGWADQDPGQTNLIRNWRGVASVSGVLLISGGVIAFATSDGHQEHAETTPSQAVAELPDVAAANQSALHAVTSTVRALQHLPTEAPSVSRTKPLELIPPALHPEYTRAHHKVSFARWILTGETQKAADAAGAQFSEYLRKAAARKKAEQAREVAAETLPAAPAPPAPTYVAPAAPAVPVTPAAPVKITETISQASTPTGHHETRLHFNPHVIHKLRQEGLSNKLPINGATRAPSPQPKHRFATGAATINQTANGSTAYGS